MTEDHGCKRTLLDKLNGDFTVSLTPPWVRHKHGFAIECPHGVRYYAEPTPDQIARWEKPRYDEEIGGEV